MYICIENYMLLVIGNIAIARVKAKVTSAQLG